MTDLYRHHGALLVPVAFSSAKYLAVVTAEASKVRRIFGWHDERFFSANGQLVVSEQERQNDLALAEQPSKPAGLACMAAFGFTDLRDDLAKVSVPVLILHGDADATVPFEGSGERTVLERDLCVPIWDLSVQIMHLIGTQIAITDRVCRIGGERASASSAFPRVNRRVRGH